MEEVSSSANAGYTKILVFDKYVNVISQQAYN